MNERIRELAFKAANGMLSFDKDGFRLSEKEVMRFAELIVQECIDIVSPYAVRMDNFDGGHPIADLKKHFVVD
ncbi:MAG: hypothetical protein EBR82_65475 [Caulobacteraceae bacterium]|nr:hypothetical protein [Caulobacteraceae bacterium]